MAGFILGSTPPHIFYIDPEEISGLYSSLPMVAIGSDPVDFDYSVTNKISGTDKADTLIATTASNVIEGYAGDDFLKGGLFLKGDAGNDTLEGGGATSLLEGGEGNDTYVYSFGYTTIFDNDTSGTKSNDLLLLKGLAKADVTFQTFNETDLRITVKATNEQIDIINAFESHTRIESFQFTDGTLKLSQVSALSTPNTTLFPYYTTIVGTDAADTLSGNFRNNLIVAGFGDDVVAGNAGHDRIYGGEGNDSLSGGKGNDELQGDAGNDTLNGGAGSDSLFESAGDDTYLFYKGGGFDSIITDASKANGNDLVILKNLAQTDVSLEIIQHFSDALILSPDDLRITIKATGETLYIAGAFADDSLIENFQFTNTPIENFQFTDGTLSLAQISKLSVLVPAGSVITGTENNDILKGSAGDDQIWGGSGDDKLSGVFGNDILKGESGNDTLIGGKGSDYLAGGEGNDVLTGGTGADTFYLDSLSDVDTITDFNKVQDTLKLNSTVFSALAGQVKAEFLSIGANAVAHDQNDYLIYDTTSGALSYDADGNGAATAVQIALLATHPALTNADFFVI